MYYFGLISVVHLIIKTINCEITGKLCKFCVLYWKYYSIDLFMYVMYGILYNTDIGKCVPRQGKPVVDNVPKKCQNTNIVGGAVDSM